MILLVFGLSVFVMHQMKEVFFVLQTHNEHAATRASLQGRVCPSQSRAPPPRPPRLPRRAVPTPPGTPPLRPGDRRLGPRTSRGRPRLVPETPPLKPGTQPLKPRAPGKGLRQPGRIGPHPGRRDSSGRRLSAPRTVTPTRPLEAKSAARQRQPSVLPCSEMP